MRDLTYIFHPWRALSAQIIQSGQIPLWNPYSACGMPFLANWQSAVFYPFSVFFYFFSFAFGLKIYHLVHIFLGGYFAYLFARHNKFSKWPSIGIMVLFGLNGYIISKMEFLSHLGTDIWIFLLLLLIRRPLLLALALCISFLAGHQMFIFLVFILLLYLLFHSESFASLKLNTTNITIAGILSLGLIACQLLPTLELVSLSARLKGGIAASVAMLHSLNPFDMLGLIFPIPVKSASLLDFTGEKFFWAKTFYIGLIASFVIIAKVSKDYLKRRYIFGLTLFLLGLILSLGNTTPVYQWLYNNFFVIKLMRYPAQFMFLSIVGLCIIFTESLKKFKYSFIFVLLLSTELLIFAHLSQTTADNSFFVKKPVTISHIQKSQAESRFILSPGTESNHLIRGKSVQDSWQKARSYFYGLSCIPYHLQNAYGMGEPLLPVNIEYSVNDTYKQISAQKALPYFKKLGIKYLLNRNILGNADGYTLISSQPLNVYELNQESKVFDFSDTNSNINSIERDYSKIKISLSSRKNSQLIWKETYVPGWKAYSLKKQIKLYSWDGLFRIIDLPGGGTTIWQKYSPLSFIIGVLVSVSFIMFFIFYGVFILKKSDISGK
ncbi:hypothetical protein ACFL58_04135 [Elusimicrobiota bacterium]